MLRILALLISLVYLLSVVNFIWICVVFFPCCLLCIFQVLSDSESVRWLNHAVEKIWPICMEQIASQKILGPIIPWFLDKYRPWTAVLGNSFYRS